MKCTLAELRNKEIINIKTGARLGYVDDIEFDTEDSMVKSFIIYGRARLFGFFGRDDDMIITCDDIAIVGVDTVLVSVEEAELAKRHTNSLKTLLK
ncbi:MAG: YlmC/YmxH family sporulation protein [Oscillospiraceae bacterium]|nr:YlmC/YmxH family sporulation protein [Oscillospiraceae bacterium]